MTLSALLQGVTVVKMFQTTYGTMVSTHDIVIRSIQYDSRKVEKGDLFVAMKGAATDGHQYITTAVSNGAAAVILENESGVPDSLFMHAGVVKIVVSNSRRTLALISANYYGHPAEKLTLIGITGTNGKTTTTFLIKHLLEAASPSMPGKVGLIGTIEYQIGNEKFPATHTTPESLELQKLFAEMVARRCTHVVMEVSSHSLHQDRVYGLKFAAAVFTNLTQDHLDYHGTMANYLAAKKMLFDGLASSSHAVTNADDPASAQIVSDTKAHILTYGTGTSADLSASNVSLTMKGTEFTLRYHETETRLQSPLVGRFNVSNILAACSVGFALGIDPQAMKEGVATMPSVPGRFEKIPSPDGWFAVVDYAHTPDALEKCLKTIRETFEKGRAGKIITVFGAGGDRDKTKRPLMGKIVDRLSDVIIVTSDNPRTEDPNEIIKNILVGIGRTEELSVEPDRRRAIALAVSLARRGDVVLIAGKGHEDYQILGTQKHHFSDREVVHELIAAATV